MILIVTYLANDWQSLQDHHEDGLRQCLLQRVDHLFRRRTESDRITQVLHGIFDLACFRKGEGQALEI